MAVDSHKSFVEAEQIFFAVPFAQLNEIYFSYITEYWISVKIMMHLLWWHSRSIFVEILLINLGFLKQYDHRKRNENLKRRQQLSILQVSWQSQDSCANSDVEMYSL